jgi:hypothetical protein
LNDNRRTPVGYRGKKVAGLFQRRRSTGLVYEARVRALREAEDEGSRRHLRLRPPRGRRRPDPGGRVVTTYEVSRVELDWGLAEDYGLDPDGDCTLYTVDFTEEMDSVRFAEWLNSMTGQKPEDLDWRAGEGMNISGAEYATVTVE